MANFRDAFIAMTFFAVFFFIFIVVIIAIWCKRRKQTEVKTVVIQPKKRPVSTKPVKQINGGGQHANGEVDLEAGIGADEIELSDDQDETIPKSASEPEVNVEQPQAAEEPAKSSSIETNSADTSNQQVQESAEKGETNPSFQSDEPAPSDS